MKKIYFFIVTLIIAISCTQTDKKSAAENEGPFKKDTAHYALALDSAKSYAQRYRRIARDIFKDTVPIKAFTIRAVDLMEAMQAPKHTKVKFDHIRIYLGIDSTHKFRLFITPVYGADLKKGIAGKDTILSGPFKRIIGGIESELTSDGSYVLDFNMPCPKTCADGSPLN